MDLVDFFNRYTNEVYLARDASAAARFIADPCLRHEHGRLEVMSLADNMARMQHLLDRTTAMEFENSVDVHDGSHYVSCYNLTFINGDERQTISGIEVFRVVDGLITETWNSTTQPGAWG